MMSWETGHPQRKTSDRRGMATPWVSVLLVRPDLHGPHHPRDSSGSICLDNENITLKNKSESVISVLMWITV